MMERRMETKRNDGRNRCQPIIVEDGGWRTSTSTSIVRVRGGIQITVMNNYIITLTFCFDRDTLLTTDAHRSVR